MFTQTILRESLNFQDKPNLQIVCKQWPPLKYLPYQVLPNSYYGNKNKIDNNNNEITYMILQPLKMSSATSANKYLTGQSEAVTQHHAWRTAQNSASHLLPHLQSSTQPIKFLDIACGSGSITASFSPLLPSGSHITAIDASAEILQKAKTHAEKEGVNNIEFRTGDVFNLEFEDGEFDVVHVSMLLAHLTEPEKAVKEILRVVKRNGGVLSLREPDTNGWSFHPALPGIYAFQKVINQVQFATTSQRAAAQMLLSWVLHCGADVKRDQVKCSASAWCFATDEERRIWGGTFVDRCVRGQMREKALKEGLATEEEFDQMKRDWEKWIEAEDGWFAQYCGEVLVYL